MYIMAHFVFSPVASSMGYREDVILLASRLKPSYYFLGGERVCIFRFHLGRVSSLCPTSTE